MKIVRLVTVNLLLLFILLAGIEAALECIVPDTRPNSVMSRYIRLREFGLPGKKVKVSPPDVLALYAENLEFKDYWVTTDSSGFIQSRKILDDPVQKIVFFGGSTTECLYVDDSLRFPSLVGEKFQEAGHSVNTYNSGVSGNQTLHSINLLVNKVIHGGFQVAVLMHNCNDLTHLAYNGSYYNEDATPTRRNFLTLALPSDKDHDLGFFRQKGPLFRAKKSFQILFPNLYDQLFYLRRKISSQEVLLEFDEWKKVKPIGEAQNDMFKANLQTFVAICKAKRITPVLMTQFNRITETEFYQSPALKPYREKLELSEVGVTQYCQYYRHFNDIIREVAAEENILLIDLDREVPKTNQFLYDMVHVNGEGSRFVAEVVYDSLNAYFFSEKTSNANSR